MTKEELFLIFKWNDIPQAEFSEYFGYKKQWIHKFLHDGRPLTIKWINYLQRYLKDIRDFEIDLLDDDVVKEYVDCIIKKGFRVERKPHKSRYLKI